MTKLKGFTLTLAAGALALSSFAAAPARADDRALFALLAGAAAVAIIANAAQADRTRVVRRDYHPAPPPPPRWQRSRWHQDAGRHGGWNRH